MSLLLLICVRQQTAACKSEFMSFWLFVAGVLIGNKCDLHERCVIPSEVAEEWAQSHGLQFFEVSAVSNPPPLITRCLLAKRSAALCMPPGRDVDVPFAYLASKWHKAYESKVEQIKSTVGA
eukprot:262548-Pyramimonas_sp.AAC.1